MSHVNRQFRVALLALLCGAQVVSAQTATSAEVKPESCLSLTQIKSTEILDRQHIVFRMNGGKVFLNTLPYPCPGLSRNRPYMHRTSIAEVCDLDIVTVLNSAGGAYMPGASCGLGKFNPSSEAQIKALKQEIKASRKN